MLQTSTLLFLKNLQNNNVKEWFDAHRKEYDAAKADFINLVGELIAAHGKKDEDIAPLEAKGSIFRINRDVRFSKNKLPYKKNLAASLARGGKKSAYAGYYLHIEPGNNSFIGGGLWAPETENLKKIRQEIDYSFDELKGIIYSAPFKKIYGDLYTDKEVLLSRPPKGYDAGNPAIEYLKLKSFIALKPLTDDELTKKNVVVTLTDAMAALQPFLRFLNAGIEG